MKGRLVILVDVENRQESYYSYIDLYMACMANDMAAITRYSEKNDLYCHLETSFQNPKERARTIEELYLSDNLYRLSQMDFCRQNVGSICLYFRLSMDDASDVTNLIYYFLIKQYMEAEAGACPVYCQLIIDDGQNMIIRFKITQFLVLESKKENSVFLKSNNMQYGYAVNLPGKAENSTYIFRSLEKFYPLLEIREDTYKTLSNTIYGTLAAGGDEVTGFPGRTHQNYMSEAMKSKDILIDMCMFYLTGEGKKEVREQTEAFFYSTDFFDAVKNMNLLSFLIMCSFEFYLSQGLAEKGEMRELSLSSFHKKIDLSNNLASGLLQIIENIIAHTKYHKGYFSFRILSENSAYLRSNYERYLYSLSQKKLKCNMHLEVKVCDLNLNKKGDYSSAITQCFLENLDRRGKDDENKRQMWQDRFREISVKDFFITGGTEGQEADIWEDYYAAKENWLHHYGLRLYARIVDKACGLFEVNSQIGLDKEPEKQHYSTLGSSAAADYLPGTQYNIILPYVAKTTNQDPIGIDSNINFDKRLQKLLNEQPEVHVESICSLIEELNMESEEGFYNFQSQKEYFVEKMEGALREKYVDTLKKKDIFPAQLMFILDARGLTSSLMQEVAAKAVWSYVCSRECGACCTDCREYILLAITNCSYELINYLSATISIYFGLNPNRKICGKTQLYICDSNGEDFLISGTTLEEIRARAYKFAASRGIFPGILTYLFSDLGKQNSSSESRERMLVEPFDILIQNDGEARFIELVKRVMDREIYYPDYGCKLSSIHIKLGSKIHIRNFYEAEILFQDSYFSKRMAYFVVKDILCKLSVKTESFSRKKLVLVGYENYSEMFLYDIHKFLKDALNYRKADIFLEDYVVCMDINGALELNRDDFKPTDDMEFIVIVSLNSSLTTFCKIKAVLEKKAFGKLKIFANYAVMLFRDDYNDSTRVYNKEDLLEKRLTELEHKYWHAINSETKMVKSRFIEQEIRYFISSIAGWEEPLRCRMCFPEKVIEEKALIYTNKISIVPSMQYGLVKKHGNAIWIDAASNSRSKKSAVLDKWDKIDRDNEIKSGILAKNVKYGHIRRNDNHFLYYFDTKTLFENSKQNLVDWLKGIERKMRSSAEAGSHAFAVYNILVTSIHESNTGFVEMINDCVFGNAAYIVRFDVNRTYRDNLVARYSNLTLLYQRLLDIANETNDYAQINFYYADDTIVSGRTYERARSLIGSLYGKINSELQKKCQVNIFTGCFLLLNRLSEESERGILGEGCVCYKYYDVPISSIRNHEDFCFMCNLIKSASQLCEKSSTNEIAQRWKKVEYRFRLKEYHKYELDTKKEIRYQNRFYSAYWANLELRRLKEDAEDTKKVCRMIVERILVKRMATKEKDADKIEILFSYIKVLSRPFFNYRWRNREAILCIIILLLEVLLNEEINTRKHIEELVNESGNFDKNSELVDILMLIKKNRKANKKQGFGKLILLHNMLVIFVKQAMELNSNYIIRKKNIIRIMAKHNEIRNLLDVFLKTCPEKEKDSDDIVSIVNFPITYTRYVKQLISLSGDEKKSIWFEKLLLTGIEYKLFPENEDEKDEDESFLKNYGIKSDFGRGLYIENTSSLDDAIKDISSEIDEISCPHRDDYETKIRNILTNKNRYYLKSFLEMLELNHFLKICEGEDRGIEFAEDCIPLLREVVGLSKMLSKASSYTLLEVFYRDLMAHFAAILNSEMCQCLIVTNESEREEVFCLFEINRKKEAYELNTAVGIPAVQRSTLEHSDDILKTFGFVPRENEDEDFYLIIKFESDLEEIDFNEEDRDDFGMIIRPIYFLFEIKDMAPENIIRRLRFILTMRAHIVRKIELDFKNNSFQKMIEEKNKKTLLSNWKNATHADEWIYSQVIGSMLKFQEQFAGSNDECPMQEYLHEIEGTVLRLLSDSNISSKYHSSLTEDMDKKYCLENDSIYAVTMPFKYSIAFRYCESLLHMPQKNKDEMLCQGIEFNAEIIEKKLFYFVGEQEQSMLIIIPIIQNALKYCKHNNCVTIYCETKAEILAKDGRKYKGLDYLCIKNPLAENKAGMVEQMKDFIKLPVGMRRQSQLDSQNGISLYAVNSYLEKLIKTIFQQQIEYSEPPLIIEQNKDDMIVKLPVLQGTIKKGEKNGKVYYY